jgi:molecular chaperone HtpG
MAKHQFQTEVNQLLHLMIHSLYSNKEIFIRELVSNASDALDKLKYLSITDDKYKDLDFTPEIQIAFDEDAKTITISDNGIGMNEEDLINNIGTIAKSGTKSFVSNLSGDAKKDSNLIGQFGVGFYSSYMVAHKVEVTSKKAGEEKAYIWTSEGSGEFDLEESTKETQGTSIKLFLKDEESEFLSRFKIEEIIKKYSNHIPFIIKLAYTETTTEGEGDDKKEVKTDKNEQINSASALWTQPKAKLKKDDYTEFYKSISHDSDEPMAYVHTKAEGTQEYITLFYIPKKAPFDMYRVDYQPNVKLYVNRVFITDDDKELLPTYLRFIKGIIDSADLPLNVSREILQQNKILANIKSASVKKILGEIKKLAKDEEKYTEFIEEFGRPLKEGLYQDHASKDKLQELVRFKSTKVDKWTGFEAYKQRMQPEQKAIYYITGENEQMLRNSPLLESFKKKDIEVLILDDEIDEIVIPSVTEYKGTPIKSVNRTDTADDLETKEDEKAKEEAKGVVEKIKKALGDEVKDVKVSSRLDESPSCIVADENDPTLQMQQMMKAMGQEMAGMGMDSEVKPILEINPTHNIVKKLDGISDENMIEDISKLLLDQALLAEGATIKDVSAFTKRLNKVIAQAL